MKFCFYLFLLSVFLVPKIILGQSYPLSRPDLKMEGTECRVKEDRLRPLISFDNPFFYNHNWDNDIKLETAQLSPERMLFIEQFGCMRHHAQMKLVVSKEAAQPHNVSFYIKELYSLMDKIHYNDLRYPNYRNDLEKALGFHVQDKGLKQKIVFPLLEHTYFLYLEPNAEGGCTLIVEIVKYVHEENIIMPGIKEYLDDGYFKPKIGSKP